MADEEKQPKEVKQDELVEKVAPDPNEAEGSIVLNGWIGKGAEPDQTRLYLDPSLTVYVEFPTDDILEKKPVDGPLGGTTVWLKAGTPIKPGTNTTKPRTPTESGETPEEEEQDMSNQADFLRGQIQQNFTQPGAGAVTPPPHICTGATCGFTCTQIPAQCPGGLPGAPNPGAAMTHVQQTNCPPATVCPQPSTLCPPGAGTAATVCTQQGCIEPTLHTLPPGCQQTHVAQTNCPPATVCPQPSTLCGGNPGDAQITLPPSVIIVQTACPPGAAGTAATVCTQFGCPQPTLETLPPMCPGGQTNVPATNCPPATVCPQPTTLCGGAVGAAAPNTLFPSVIIVQTACPPGAAAPAPGTAATLCTQEGCPTRWPQCPTPVAPAAQEAVGAPTPSAVTQCAACEPILSAPPNCPTANPACMTLLPPCPTQPPLCPGIPGAVPPRTIHPTITTMPNCISAEICPNTGPPQCPATLPAGCTGAGEVGAGIPVPTQPPICFATATVANQCQTVEVCPLSAPPNCPTVQACGGEVGAGIPVPTQPPICFATATVANQCQTIEVCPLSAPPNCPTVQQCGAGVSLANCQETRNSPLCQPFSAPPNCPTVQQCGGGGEVGAGTDPLSAPPNCPTVLPMCMATQPPLCLPTQLCVSVPGHCPTVDPPCGGVSLPTQCPTVPPMCPVTQWQCPTQAPACPPPLSVPPNCPTVQQCPPAQGEVGAAAITNIADLCTASPIVCAAETIAGKC